MAVLCIFVSRMNEYFTQISISLCTTLFYCNDFLPPLRPSRSCIFLSNFTFATYNYLLIYVCEIFVLQACMWLFFIIIRTWKAPLPPPPQSQNYYVPMFFDPTVAWRIIHRLFKYFSSRLRKPLVLILKKFILEQIFSLHSPTYK